ncbi:MAG: polysaccharide pyruvyl transferase family protein [Clostridia bacterium]|nr:polysaccharide pyruvyl transferase family protein [Clostridia bacterium]
MKKIGILTHHYIHNYGAFLQGYSLQEALKELYPNDDVYMIDYVNKKHAIKNTLGWFRYNPKKDSLKSYIQKTKIPKIFKGIQKKYYNLTTRVHNVNELNELGLDAIVVGSDEVWHYEDIAKHPMKFGYGVKVDKLISYAPSTGSSNVNENIPDYVKEGMKNFTALSARDDNAETLIRNVLGKEATRVLDPTLLYEFPEYKSKFVDYIKSQKYILMYYCDNLPESIKEKIVEYAEKNGFKIFGAGEYKKWFTETFVDIDPFEWVEMFRNAQLVFTGTFHGTVFSIKSRKNFYAYLTNPSRVKKVCSLLKQFKIDNRIITVQNWKLIFESMEDNINYNDVFQNIEIEKEKSLEYIKKSINN